MLKCKSACFSLSLCWLIGLLATFSLGCWASDDVEDIGFLSDDPNRATGWAGPGVGTGGGSGGGANLGFVDTSDEAERAIEEADIIQVADGRLYTLSLYGGLCVIDVSVHNQLTMLGRYRIRGYPFGMILRDKMVIAMVNAPLLGWDDSTGSTTDHTSRIVALDTSNPRAINEMGSIEVSGAFVASHLVNDVFYVVSLEEYSEPGTVEVLSLSVANPGSVQIIDREVFDSYGCGTRGCVTVAKDRMYIAGIERLGDDNSTIRVLDISDPAGTMELGAVVKVAGQVENRSQVDEHEGMLRVISQPHEIGGIPSLPVVETFSVVSAQQVSPVGSLEMVSPERESLRSVRFDGERGYAVTFKQTDALRTFDLSDPANPRQAGALELPGWLTSIEPRGDRLIGLGDDGQSMAIAMAVTLFDVTDLGNPTVLDRVSFGAQLGFVAGGQNRIDKSLRILDDDGLILVPFSGSRNDACGSHGSGIQLIDFTADALTTRGIATQDGMTPRAFLHEDRLFSVSDAAVSIFDITDRGAPTEEAHVAISHSSTNTAVIGANIARVEGDWTGIRLSVVPFDDPERDEPVGSLDLSNLSPPCYASNQYGPRVLAFGSHAVLLWANRQFSDHGAGGHGTGMAVIDMSDPTNPTLLSQMDFDFDLVQHLDDDYSEPSALLAIDEAYALVGTTLVLQEAPQRTDEKTAKPHKLHLVDLADPANPVHASTVTLPSGLGQTPLQPEGNIVFTSHWEPVYPGKVRFWVDRIDISNPASPQALPAINVPGSLLARDSNTGRMATVGYTNEIIGAADWEQCRQMTDSIGHFRDDSGECLVTHRTLQLVDVQDSMAALRDSLPLEDGDYGRVALGEDRLFLLRFGVQATPGGDPDRLSMVSGLGEGGLQLTPSTTVSGSTILAQGKRVLAMKHFPPTLTVFDGTDATSAPTLLESEERWGNMLDVTLYGEDAICSLGSSGVSVVSLSE
jgi:hypothetical protein